jgi:hypothetical protein
MEDGFDEIPEPPLLVDFRSEIYGRLCEIDPEGREDVFTLALGWAVAKGMEPRDARDFAIYVRYQSDMG